MVRARHVFVVLVMLLALPTNAYSWGAKGHRTVAQVASRHLNDDARAAVERILGRGELRLARAATWPDEVRSDSNWSDIAPWHFLTTEDTVGFASQVQPVAQIDSIGNVAQAIEFFSDILGGDRAKRAQFEDFMAERGAEPYRDDTEATALALVIHFVGDVHEPLHVGRGADRGGNSIRLNWFGSPTNLHTVWDEGLIEKQDLSFTELARFVDDADPATVSSWQAAPLMDWVQESKDLRAQVYAFGALPDLGYAYAFENTGTVNQRLLQGGVRLAARLNSIFQ